MKKPAVWLAVLFCALVFGYLVYSSTHVVRYRCELCITFNGRRNCSTASAATREQAVRAATENACALISGGVVESSQCEQTKPDSFRWLE